MRRKVTSGSVDRKNTFFLSLKESLTYTPVELDFGTSGLRGLVKDMTDLECYINTCGFIEYLIDIKDIQKGDTVCLAGDLRPSTQRILAAVACAIKDSGCGVDYCGLIPTPAVTYYGITSKKASIMVTGSHLSEERNGIKFNKSTGEVLKEDEKGIKEMVKKIRVKIYNIPATDSPFDSQGRLKVEESLGPINSEGINLYLKRYLDVFPPQCLSDKRILVYQHSAVGRDILVEILEKLGAEVIPIGRSNKFIAVDTENITEKDLRYFQELIKSYSNVFALVSTDGDGDRPLVIDEKGNFLRGDLLGLVVAKYLNVDFVVVPVSANDAVDIELDKVGIRHFTTRIGSPYAIKAMTNAEFQYTRRVAWETNGGFLVGSDIILSNDKTLKALPTRDALLPIICILLTAKEQNIPLSEVFAPLPKRYTQAGLIKFKMGMSQFQKISQEIIKTISPEDKNILEIDFVGAQLKVKYKDKTLDYLTAEMKIFNETDKEVQEIVTKKCLLETKYLTANLGFTGSIVKMNFLDGVRIKFGNYDIVHFRPSGNAPEFRCYANADSQRRADEIVHLVIREPKGVLWQIMEDFVKKDYL